MYDLNFSESAGWAVDGMGGESIVYSPKTGAARTITAIVERHAPEQFDAGGPMFSAITITVRNHATSGILATSINWGGDTVTLAATKGGTAAAYLLVGPAPISQDAGMVTLAVNVPQRR
ncbi:MAG TPA: hypothetical protein VEA69_15825 [Tepidisphaeraceae bacterium]|nr:hypothetical protein [Tepidisphaeraceae bacterium]